MAKLEGGLAARLAIAVSFGFGILRLSVARDVGFGDSEALYACYALHPQPAYLDHPGLIGRLALWLGHGTAPTPTQAHVFTSVAATALPWLGALAAWATGASWSRACRVVLALALVPEFSIGLFGLTPDLPLAFFWIGGLAFAALALRAEQHSWTALLTSVGAGACAGAACLSKASGAFLALTLFAFSLTRAMRPRWRTVAPWAATALAAILVAPVLIWEARRGWPMLVHRIIAQAGGKLWARNLAVLVFGQLLYVTPPFLVGAYFLLRDLWRRNRDPTDQLLWLITIVPALPLVALSVWSRSVEPHWIAPAYLGLAIHVARTDAISARWSAAALAAGTAVVLAVFAWIQTPLPMRLLGNRYDARQDITNDLLAWGPGRSLLKQAVEDTAFETSQTPVVIGPHWTICAQAHAALASFGSRIPVGCNDNNQRDDFDDWLPRPAWRQNPTILFVTDSRFATTPSFPDRHVRRISEAAIYRHEKAVRVLRIIQLDISKSAAL